MKKLTLFTMFLCVNLLSAQLITNTAVSNVLSSEDFENKSTWVNYDQAGASLLLDNSQGGTESFNWSSAWGGACVNGDQSAIGGLKSMQVHWGGYAILGGYTIDLTKTYQIEVMIHPAGGNDGTWNNWGALHLFTFESSELWQNQGIRIRLMNGGAGNNPNTLAIDVWEGDAGTERNANIIDFNSSINDYYVNGTTASYWVPLKVIFTGEGTTTNPLLMDFYLNNKFVGSQTFNSLYWLGDSMIGFGRCGSDPDAAKFDNIKISLLSKTTGINTNIQDDNYFFNNTDFSINFKGSPSNNSNRYELFNTIGVKIYSGLFLGNKAIIPSDKLPKGVYLTKIYNENNTHSSLRFVVR